MKLEELLKRIYEFDPSKILSTINEYQVELFGIVLAGVVVVAVLYVWKKRRAERWWPKDLEQEAEQEEKEKEEK